jgi:hypothetical protein
MTSAAERIELMSRRAKIFTGPDGVQVGRSHDWQQQMTCPLPVTHYARSGPSAALRLQDTCGPPSGHKRCEMRTIGGLLLLYCDVAASEVAHPWETRRVSRPSSNAEHW